MAALRLAVRPSLRILAAPFKREAFLAVESSERTWTHQFSSGGITLNLPYKFTSEQESELRHVDYIETNDPEEWKYVERLLPPRTVPQPIPRTEYPSGWKPPNDEIPKLPYFVSRSKNHMLPVYLNIGHRGIGKRTVVKKIHGDIWSMEEELKQYLIEKSGKRIISSQAHEMCGWIMFRGDYVRHCQEWLESKGF